MRRERSRRVSRTWAWGRVQGSERCVGCARNRKNEEKLKAEAGALAASPSLARVEKERRANKRYCPEANEQRRLTNTLRATFCQTSAVTSSGGTQRPRWAPYDHITFRQHPISSRHTCLRKKRSLPKERQKVRLFSAKRGSRKIPKIPYTFSVCYGLSCSHHSLRYGFACLPTPNIYEVSLSIV